MANPVQPRGPISRIRLRAAGISVALLLVFLPVVVPAQSERTWTFTPLFSFKHPRRDGAIPYGGVIKDKGGNLYGTTFSGGLYGHWGTVFKLDKTGKETVVHRFRQGPNGYYPSTGLIQDKSGSLYGTTGGDYSFFGTVFKMTADGKQTVLYRFSGGADGADPSKLLRDAVGNLYGTTYAGGTSDWGTVFKVDKHGKETVLYSFTGGADGAAPRGELIRDQSGNLYGTASYTVFKVDTAGNETVLYSFTEYPDGGDLRGGLVTDSDGNLYGATGTGGDLTCNAPDGCGTLFKLDRTGSLTVLYSFKGGRDGIGPGGTLVRDSAGSLYGTTNDGGDDTCQAPSGCGTVFKLDSAGKETVLHRFSGGADGALPSALFRDARGNLYGTTTYGGDLSCVDYQFIPGCGTVFKLRR